MATKNRRGRKKPDTIQSLRRQLKETTARFEEEVETLRQLRLYDAEKVNASENVNKKLQAELKAERIKAENRLMQGLATIAEAIKVVVQEATRP